MIHLLPPLPFVPDALQPVMSAETVRLHHDQHHRGYVDKLNELVVGTVFEDFSLKDLVRQATGAIFNQGAQAWNHEFLWNCLAPDHPAPAPEVLAILNRSFGSFDQFTAGFKAAAVGLFGSGWVWLTRDPVNGRLAIETTTNADNPLRQGRIPVLATDVWEHAYYLDYRNERAKYLDQVVTRLNWGFAARNLGRGYDAPAARTAA